MEQNLENATNNFKNITNETFHRVDPPEIFLMLYDWLISMGLFIGISADILLIIILGCNGRFRTKTYLILLNVAISDLLMLFCYTETFKEIVYLNVDFQSIYLCIFSFLEELLQSNVVIFLIILASTTLMKNKRIKIRYILIVMYIFILLSTVAHTISCNYKHFLWGPTAWFFTYVFFVIYILVKECNSCYKQFVKKDPLSRNTKFRFDLARIYCYNWFFVHFCMVWYWNFAFRNIIFHWFILFRILGFVNSLFIVVYLIRCDRVFKESFLNLIHFRKMNSGCDTTVIYEEKIDDVDIEGDQVESPNEDVAENRECEILDSNDNRIP